jgi:hypothetical protein
MVPLVLAADTELNGSKSFSAGEPSFRRFFESLLGALSSFAIEYK